jgi:hypothetical protein
MRGALRIEDEAHRWGLALLVACALSLTGCLSRVPLPTPEAKRVSALCAPKPGVPWSPTPRAPRPIADSSWDKCPFPKPSYAARIDEAYVVLQITVAPTGAAQSASILCDPGYGFAEIARDCALGHEYGPAQDENGNHVPGTMKLRVHFSR